MCDSVPMVGSVEDSVPMVGSVWWCPHGGECVCGGVPMVGIVEDSVPLTGTISNGMCTDCVQRCIHSCSGGCWRKF